MNTYDSLAWLSEEHIPAIGDDQVPTDTCRSHLGNAIQALEFAQRLSCETDGGQIREYFTLTEDQMKTVKARLMAVLQHIDLAISAARMLDDAMGRR